jgi:hypothetical protein
MTNVDPKMDFRWQDSAGVELEAYQVTLAARWDSEHWPPWLQTQKAVEEINKVYTDAAHPKSLFIYLESGRYEIERDAYIIHDGGTLRVMDSERFETHYDKVVPIPPKEINPESLPNFELTHKMEDGKLVPLTPEEIEAKQLAQPPKPEVPAIPLAPGTDSDVSEMRNEMMSAIRLLKKCAEEEGDGLPPSAEEALDYLIHSMSKRTRWCNCPPGQCSQEDEAGCRLNSPLVT